MTKLAYDDSDVPIKVNITAGSCFLTLDEDHSGALDAMMAPGVTVRVGDQDLVIDEVNGDIAWFTPYHTHGCEKCNVLLEETFIATGDLQISASPSSVQITKSQIVGGLYR